MSVPTHKRKRSLQDSTVDLSKMRMTLNRVEALLKAEFKDGIEETEEDLHSISERVLATLRGAKKPKVTFSTVTFEDLEEAGIKRKCLIFEPEKLADLREELTTDAEAEIADLHSRIKKIYARVNMDHEPGSRMILDAILLALVEIVSTEKSGVAILPEVRIASQNGVQISHPASGIRDCKRSPVPSQGQTPESRIGLRYSRSR